MTEESSKKIEYFYISPKKLLVLSILSLGIYDLYWFYKNWYAVRHQGGEKVSPVLRAIFAIFFCYGLFNRISDSADEQGYKKGIDAPILAVWYIIGLIIGNGFARVEVEGFGYMLAWVVVIILGSLPLYFVQKAVNFNNEKLNPEYKKKKRRLSVGEIILLIIGIILSILSLISFIPIPEDYYVESQDYQITDEQSSQTSIGAGVDFIEWQKGESGLSFEYPDEYLTVSMDEFDFSSSSNLYVEVGDSNTPIGPCFESSYMTIGEYRQVISNIYIGTINDAVREYDSLSCNWTAGSVTAKKITVGNYNGIEYTKALIQDHGSLSNFYKQVVIVDDDENVYSITIPYDFGPVKEYLDTFRNEFGGAYKWGEELDKFFEVYEYVKGNGNIYTDELRVFEENDAIINRIIDSIEIN